MALRMGSIVVFIHYLNFEIPVFEMWAIASCLHFWEAKIYFAKVHDPHSPTQVNQKAANASLIKGHSAKNKKFLLCLLLKWVSGHEEIVSSRVVLINDTLSQVEKVIYLSSIALFTLDIRNSSDYT